MIYLDTSAFFKLIQPEAETPAMTATLVDRGDLVSSVLLVVETRRAVLRRFPERAPAADLLLGRVDTIGMSDVVIESAGRLPDPLLRSLDAIHLATALLLREDLTLLLTYDTRLAAAARAHDLPVDAPA